MRIFVLIKDHENSNNRCSSYVTPFRKLHFKILITLYLPTHSLDVLVTKCNKHWGTNLPRSNSPNLKHEKAEILTQFKAQRTYQSTLSHKRSSQYGSQQAMLYAASYRTLGDNIKAFLSYRKEYAYQFQSHSSFSTQTTVWLELVIA